MPRGRVITAEIKKKILQLIIVGLTDTEIAAALKISSDVVHKYRKNKDVKKDVGEPENHHGSEQKTGKHRRHRDPDSNKPAEDRRPAGDHIENTVPAGGRINFTGGKKHTNGGKTDMSKEGKEEFEWKCPKCGHEWNGSADKCPKCGADLQE